MTWKPKKHRYNLSKVTHRTENGTKVVIYVTITTAILMAHYKRLKELTGYKIAKRKFAQDLEKKPCLQDSSTL